MTHPRALPLAAGLLSVALAGCVPPDSIHAGAIDYRLSSSRGGAPLHVSGRGPIEFTDDGRDIASLAPDGALTIEEGTWLRRLFLGGTRAIVLRAEADGTLAREFYVAGERRAWEPEGAAWMAQALGRLVDAGFASRARVAQLLRTSGVDGVLQAIPLLATDYLQGTYLRHLLEQSDARDATLAPALALAGQLIASDYELARTLRAARDRAIDDQLSRAAFMDAAATISSDYELQRVLAEIVARIDLPADALDDVLRTAVSIQSDYEMGRLLRAVAERHGVEAVRGPFFAAAGSVASDYEHARVLAAVLQAGALSDDTLDALLESAADIQSDHELSRLLVSLAGRSPLGDSLRERYLSTAATLSSTHERNRAIAALVGAAPGAQAAREP